MSEYFEAGLLNILDKTTDTYHKMLAIKGDKGDPGPVASEEVIRRVTAEEVAKVIAEAPEDFDTLKEIADWINTHKDDASAMNTAILENARQISMLQDDRDDINDNIDTNINPRISKNSTEIANTKPNLIPFPYYDGMSKTTNGITFTVNADGSITVNGTASANAFFNLVPTGYVSVLPKGTYILSTGEAINNLFLVINFNGTQYNENSGAFTITEDKTYIMYLYIPNGTVLNNIVVKPMLVEGETAPTKYKMFGNMTCVGTLASGETTLELVSDKITKSSMIEPPYFYITDGSEVEPISYNTVKVENGKVTYTFDAMDTDLLIGIRVL